MFQIESDFKSRDKSNDKILLIITARLYKSYPKCLFHDVLSYQLVLAADFGSVIRLAMQQDE